MNFIGLTAFFLLNLQPMTLAEVEQAALANNPEIQAIAKRVDLAEARVGGAGAFEDPSFMYRGWGAPLFEPWNVNQAQHMFMFSQNVPGPGKRGLRYLIAAEGADIAKLEVAAKRRQILARVRTAFYALLRSYDQVRLHGEQVALARQGISAARIKYTVGHVPQQDVLKAQIALTRLVDHLVMFQQEADIARTALNTLMGRDPADPLEVTGEYRALESLPSYPELQKTALENRPELQGAAAIIHQAETKTKLAEKAYTPDFSISAGYMLMPGGSANRNGIMAEFSMTLPWWNRGKHDAEIAEAYSDLAVLRSEYASLAAQVSREIREALIRADAAKKLAELYRDTLRPQAAITLRAATAAYQTDQTDFLNLLDSQNASIEVEYAYFQAITDYETRLTDLELAIGTELVRGQQ